MYCVQCGVRLQDGVERCPLCQTPVWNPEKTAKTLPYPDRYPPVRNENKGIAFVLTVFFLLSDFVLLLVSLNQPTGKDWGGIAMLGVALAFIVFVLPLWIEKMPVFLSLAVDHVAIGGYLLYLSCRTNGGWFLSFAFPIVGMSCILTVTTAVLLKYTRKGRFFLFGGALILLGAFTVLLELAEHITFSLPMFLWSPYSASVLFLAGMFLILAGIIRPLKAFLTKLFYI